MGRRRKLEVYREGYWRVCHDESDQIIIQCRTLGIWVTWTEPVGHDTWLTVVFPDYESAIRLVLAMAQEQPRLLP